MKYTVDGTEFEIDFTEIGYELSNKALATMESVQAYVANRMAGRTVFMTSGQWFVNFMKSNPSQEEIVNWFEHPHA